MADKKEQKPKILVYSTPTCPYCIKAKEYLKTKGYDYENIDVSTNQEKAKEMVKKSGQMGVPVLDINGTIIVGFDQDKIDEAIAGKAEKEEKKEEKKEKAEDKKAA